MAEIKAKGGRDKGVHVEIKGDLIELTALIESIIICIEEKMNVDSFIILDVLQVALEMEKGGNKHEH